VVAPGAMALPPLTGQVSDGSATILPGVPATADDVYLVQFDRPLSAHRFGRFRDLVGTLLERVGPSTVAVQVAGGNPETVAGLNYVTGVRRALPEDSLDPRLVVPSDPTTTGVAFDVLLLDPAMMPVVLDWLAARAISIIGTGGRKVRLLARRDDPRIGELAALPQVRTIDEYREPTLSNDYARVAFGVDAADGTPAVPWTGLNQVVGIADSGVDRSHPALAGRIARIIPRGRPDDPGDPDGHGTHVAGSIVGGGPTARGVAPNATLVVQSLLSPTGRLIFPVDLGEMLDEARAAGVHIHNNSWGAPAGSAYRITSFELDDWASRNQEMLVVVAAGNEATGKDPVNSTPGFVDWLSITSPATAKNALTVGASCTARDVHADRSWRRYDSLRFADDPIGSERLAGQPERLAAFSGRGPCSDQLRLKPDVVAPGTYILSTRSSTAPAGKFWDLHDEKYAYLGGTSMAAPLVAGLAALIREYYVRDRACSSPSAALLKATIINGARPLNGADAVADPGGEPNYHQGFGHVDLIRSLPVPGRNDAPGRLEFVDTSAAPGHQLTANGQARRYIVRVGGPPVRICLAWTDPPGNGVQNPLALTVRHTESGDRFAGNDQRPAGPVRMLDNANNVQRIRLDDAAPGIYEIQVTATNLLHPPQSFALVVAGGLTSELAPTP